MHQAIFCETQVIEEFFFGIKGFTLKKAKYSCFIRLSINFHCYCNVFTRNEVECNSKELNSSEKKLDKILFAVDKHVKKMWKKRFDRVDNTLDKYFLKSMHRVAEKESS